VEYATCVSKQQRFRQTFDAVAMKPLLAFIALQHGLVAVLACECVDMTNVFDLLFHAFATVAVHILHVACVLLVPGQS